MQLIYTPSLTHVVLAYPEVLGNAYEELDRAIGRNRFPSWEDEPDLPYIRPIIKEKHYWRSLTALGKSIVAFVNRHSAHLI